MKLTKAHFGILLVFVAGIAVGVESSNFCRLSFFAAKPVLSKERLMEKVSDELELTHEQISKIQPIIFSLHSNLRALRMESLPKIEAAVKESTTQMAVNLNPEQKIQLDKMVEKFLNKQRQAIVPPTE